MQIDVILKYASRAAALADLADQTSVDESNVRDFLSDRAIPDLKVWRASQDNPDGTHNFLSGYFVLISLPRIVPALRDNAAVQCVINADDNTILRKTVTNAVMQDLRFSPVFAGRNYPVGSWP